MTPPKQPPKQFVLTSSGAWAVVDGDNDGDAVIVGGGDAVMRDAAQQLWRTTTWLDMLNDRARNAAYARAMRRVVQSGVDRVLDIGAGCGILSMYAARAGATGVVGLEEYALSARVAREATASDATISVVNARSDAYALDEGDQRFSVLVSELLDSALLGEGWLCVARDARARLLEPNARSIPRRARVYFQLVDFDGDDMRAFFEHESRVLGNGFWRAREHGVVWCGKAQQAHADAWMSSGRCRPLSGETAFFEIDFERLPGTNAPDARWTTTCVVVDDGVVDGVVWWWEIDLDDDGEIRYSTAPGKGKPWSHHWRQCVALAPERARKSVTKGERVDVVSAIIDDVDIRMGFVVPSDDIDEEEDEEPPTSASAVADASLVVANPWYGALRTSTPCRIFGVGARFPEFIASKAKLGVAFGADVSAANALLYPLADDAPVGSPEGAVATLPPAPFRIFDLAASRNAAIVTASRSIFEIGSSSSTATTFESVDGAAFDCVVLFRDDQGWCADAPFAPPIPGTLCQSILIIPEHARAASVTIWCGAPLGDDALSTLELRFATLVPHT